MRRAKVGFTRVLLFKQYRITKISLITGVVLVWYRCGTGIVCVVKSIKDDPTTAAGDFTTKVSLSAITIWCRRSETYQFSCY